MTGKVKVFVIGDLHFRKNFLTEGREFSIRCTNAIKKYAPDFIVILGDTLHTNDKTTQKPFGMAYYFIEAVSEIAPVYLLIGNHDYSSPKQFLTDAKFTKSTGLSNVKHTFRTFYYI